MKLLTIFAATLGLAATTLPVAASARNWQPINVRQARIDNRIDTGIRNGALNRREAQQLRREFNALNQLETRYRRSGGGLNAGERRDLDRRFDALSARVKYEKQDRQTRR